MRNASTQSPHRSESARIAALPLLALAIVLAAAAWSGTRPDAPHFPGKEWPVSTPEAEGVDPVAVAGLHTAIADGQHGLIDHYLLIVNGKAIADHHYDHDYRALSQQYDPENEQYDYDSPDWHPYYRGQAVHTLQSATKSVTSVLVGIAVDDGAYESLAQPVVSFFPDRSFQRLSERKKAMTVEDLLTMRAGIEWDEWSYGYDDPRNSCIQLEASEDWIQFVLDLPMASDPGTSFVYNSGASVLLGATLRAATGTRIDEFAERRLFGPLGIEDYYWKVTPLGEIDTEGGLYLEPHDLARIGFLFLRDGVWEGERIVSSDWIRRSTAPVVADIRPDNGRTDSGYGYKWWVLDQKDGKAEVFAAMGFGGQFLMVAPERDLVAVFTGWNIHGNSNSIVGAFLRQIVPAVPVK